MRRNYWSCLALILGLLFVPTSKVAGQDRAEREKESVREKLSAEAKRLRPLVSSKIANEFLDQVKNLPKIEPREVYYDKKNRKAISKSAFEKLSEQDRASFKKTKLDESFYYLTRYGSPLAFVRTLELVGNTGLEKLEGAAVADFGFGTIGHLRLMANAGAKVRGIEVDSLLKVLYSKSTDTGTIKTDGKTGEIQLAFGSFPSDKEVAARIPKNLDLFVSKNTLKRGYIHPSKPAPKRLLIDLGVGDKVFCEQVFERLKPGGIFLIYNLHPAQAPEGKPYIPWADGRCPFDRSVLEEVGFRVIEFDKNDTKAAHQIARALGWEKQMDLKKNLFATYTLLRKPKK